ncbi:hypothetical protein [Deinococcus cellulosilyticus]|uniref:Yip1 domain-containing protein n=1 Tax=Deinococcus cellulosilyticus (strain DSM 18568 / NBRC 106333 / KACC 11606 / 5516J-15) TaxID=1223518 RepID=A0A511N4Z6_DEIC1|nr:hypothetical protein [Deinococcus cellulosilyticus]GEM47922.1 hypothetical protein DC3_35570 [Deinococcus cellulosilyticus NBRC 106333 = KACC 11606]
MIDPLLILYRPQQFYRKLFESWPQFGKLMATIGLTMLVWGVCQYVTSKLLMHQLGLDQAFRAPEGVAAGAGIFQAMWIFFCWLMLSVAVALGATFHARPFETTGYALAVSIPVVLVSMLIQMLVISGLPAITPAEMQSILNHQNGTLIGKLVIHAEELYVRHPLVITSQILMLGTVLWQVWVIQQALQVSDVPTMRRIVFSTVLAVVFGLLQYNFSPHWRILQEGVLRTITQPEFQQVPPKGGSEL